MQTLFSNIKGDRLIWAIAALLAIFLFLPVYSAASNLAYVSGDGDTFNYFVKHFLSHTLYKYLLIFFFEIAGLLVRESRLDRFRNLRIRVQCHRILLERY